MYSWLVRKELARLMKRFSDGDIEYLLSTTDPAATLCFPGDNPLAAMFRPVQRGRRAVPTHRGIDECRAFARWCADNGLQFKIEDVMVAGPPWNMRIAARMHNFIPGESVDDPDRYNNRFVACLNMRWGRLTAWEDYEDTQRVADFFASDLATLPVGQR